MPLDSGTTREEGSRPPHPVIHLRERHPEPARNALVRKTLEVMQEKDLLVHSRKLVEDVSHRLRKTLAGGLFGDQPDELRSIPQRSLLRQQATPLTTTERPRDLKQPGAESLRIFECRQVTERTNERLLGEILRIRIAAVAELLTKSVHDWLERLDQRSEGLPIAREYPLDEARIVEVRPIGGRTGSVGR
jgi:hypothetical protein